jgi:hypothetical protein
MPEPMDSSEGSARASGRSLFIAAGVVLFLVCTALVLEISGRIHPQHDWSLGERPFNLLDFALWAFIVLGAAACVVLWVVCLFTRAWKHALMFVAMFLIAPLLALLVSGLIAPSSTTSGLAAWTKSVDTTPVNAWLASNPPVVPSSATPFATYYVQDTSALSRASSIAATSVPRFDTGRLPDEVLLLPAKDAIFAVYHTGWRASRIVIIGPAATSIPPHFHPSCTWTTIRSDLVVGEFIRS